MCVHLNKNNAFCEDMTNITDKIKKCLSAKQYAHMITERKNTSEVTELTESLTDRKIELNA